MAWSAEGPMSDMMALRKESRVRWVGGVGDEEGVDYPGARGAVRNTGIRRVGGSLAGP